MTMRVNDSVDESAVRYVALAARVGKDFVAVEDHRAEISAGYVFVHNNAHTGVTSGTSYWHVLTTGARPCTLTTYHVTSDVAPIWIALSEAPTSSGGTAASFINRNRRSSNTPLATMVEGATVSDAGTHLEGDYAAGTKQSGGGGEIVEAWPLKPNTKYGFLVRNDSTGTAALSFHLEITETPT